MIIQRVIKGITGEIGNEKAQVILDNGILCKWWQNVNPLPNNEILWRLTERNLIWHQNHYDMPDPLESYQPFCDKTPFISTTAGTVERDAIMQRNVLIPAWLQALYFASDSFERDDGYLYYCYIFVLGKKAVGHHNFAEELRELNVYTGFSPFHPEGEVTAKIIIPSAQIQKVEHWSLDKVIDDLNGGSDPQPIDTIDNPSYLPPEDYSNVRDLLW